MAWRFKASKYKNAAPIVPKPESCVREISVGSYQTFGNNIAASAAFMAFNVDHNGSSLGVLPIDDSGRKGKAMPLLHAHSDTVTDMDFSNFHDGILATGSQDCMVKVWHIPEKGLEESLTNSEVTFSHRQRRVECVRWHPTVDCLLTSTSFTTITLWDVTVEKELYSYTGKEGLVQSISWKPDGKLLAFHTKEKSLNILDPRSGGLTQSTSSHQSIKDSRVVFLGDSNRILTTGFDAARQREVYMRDLRSLKVPVKTLVMDSSTGILIPLYDPDTSMLFLAGKGDTTINYLEVTEKEPYLVEGIRHTGEQTKGACLVPKRALNVMQAEVNRVLQLTSSSVIPIMYQVPRKSYREFHSELFPSTPGCKSSLFPNQWILGTDTPVPKISLNPSDNQTNQIHRGNLASLKEEIQDRMREAIAKINVTKPLDQSQERLFRSNLPPLRSSLFEKDQNEANELKNRQTQREENGGGCGGGDPPKPMPRVSRTASEEEQQPPKPRPRTNSTQNQSPPFLTSINISQGYKPRLGPKPFTPPKLDEDSPTLAARGHEAPSPRDNIMTTSLPPDFISNSNSSTNGNDESDTKSQPDHENNDEEADGVEEADNGDDEEEVGGGTTEPLERGGGLRQSIAERRKMYEVRSQSLTEPPPPASAVSPVSIRRKDSNKTLTKSNTIKEDDNRDKRCSNPPKPSLTPTSTAPKRTSTVFGRVSKFRHLKGTPAHKSQHIENVRNVSRQISGECDGFHCNKDRVCVPLGGPGGKLAVFELRRPGKLPDGVTPTLVNAANIMDFAWDPFNSQRLAVGCDDGSVKLWVVPETGLTEPTNTPQSVLQAHVEKIFCIKFHPLARDILATTSYDMMIRIWDLANLKQAFSIKTDDQVVALAWSPCGRLLAAVTRGSTLTIYEPRVSLRPVAEGKGPGGTRGARVVWALDGQYIALLGFDKVSERQILLFKSSDLSTPVATIGLDVSPAILIPFYDEDSSTLFCTGRGDSTIYTFEVSSEAPFLNPLSHHRSSSLHQGLSFLPKNCVDVSQVEFAKALRLTNTTIEPLSFTVPRIKSDLFQDDLFPDTKVSWEPTMEGQEWLAGSDVQQRRLSLKPPTMDSLSEAQGGPVSCSPPQKLPPPTTPSSRISWSEQTVKEKQLQIQKSLSSRVSVNLKLEQDDMEGVDETEWNDNIE